MGCAVLRASLIFYIRQALKMYKLKSILHNPVVHLVAVVWGVFAALFIIMNELCSTQIVNIWPYIMTVFSAATTFTLPLLWCRPRWRWTMWAAIGVVTIFVYVNIVYRHSFDSLMPLSSILDAGNLDGMVLSAAIDTFKWKDCLAFVPLIILIILWFSWLRSKVRNRALSYKSALFGSITMAVFWIAMQVGSTWVYSVKREANLGDKMWKNPETTILVQEKFKGKFSERINYLLNNGMDVYLIWSIRDFTPKIKLGEKDEKMVSEYISNQKALDANHPVSFERYGEKSGIEPNLLIIMVESLETWALEYKQDGKPVLSYIDSLINLPGTLYFPHLVSQVSSGHSSDGHLQVLSGILPLRESAAVTDFADNEYPSLIKAFKEKYGGNAIEIISDSPMMWNQGVTYKHYGFDELFHSGHIDPEKKTSWGNRDPYLSKFVCEKLKEISTPFAMMAVTLSLHTPYRDELRIYPELKTLPIDNQSIHYLQICRMDEVCIHNMITTLKNRGIYENTIIIITGDHSAHGLSDKVRPPETSGKEKFIPLLVLNTDFKTQTYEGVAGQIDIYPTLLDILGLENYGWRGLGLSLLRHNPSGATRRNFEIYGELTPEEAKRQNTAWKVSELIIRSDYISDK